METLIGIAMFYSWVHSIIIIFKKLKDTTNYENVVLISALVGAFLFVVGALS